MVFSNYVLSKILSILSRYILLQFLPTSKNNNHYYLQLSTKYRRFNSTVSFGNKPLTMTLLTSSSLLLLLKLLTKKTLPLRLILSFCYTL